MGRGKWSLHDVWVGDLASILPELEERSKTLGSACQGVRRSGFDGLRYLRNKAQQMRYDQYRREGLPIMSCGLESAT